MCVQKKMDYFSHFITCTCSWGMDGYEKGRQTFFTSAPIKWGYLNFEPGSEPGSEPEFGLG